MGTWSVERDIDDRHDGLRRSVVGLAELALLVDGRVRWHEHGTMSWPGMSVPVSRTLYVEPRAQGWWVTFEDGRDFHPWEPGVQVDHPCGRDHYRGLLEPGSPAGGWTITWEVRGPAKDYTMVAAHRPLHG
ncbi:DUF6314 family protein [Nocardioides kribbensis]|uniref:DUF6314 family protein n=1 Tax=Nocardioides kribbensis TaxID=305517 RepID=UPI0032DA2830